MKKRIEVNSHRGREREMNSDQVANKATAATAKGRRSDDVSQRADITRETNQNWFSSWIRNFQRVGYIGLHRLSSGREDTGVKMMARASACKVSQCETWLRCNCIWEKSIMPIDDDSSSVCSKVHCSSCYSGAPTMANLTTCPTLAQQAKPTYS